MTCNNHVICKVDIVKGSNVLFHASDAEHDMLQEVLVLRHCVPARFSIC